MGIGERHGHQANVAQEPRPAFEGSGASRIQRKRVRVVIVRQVAHSQTVVFGGHTQVRGSRRRCRQRGQRVAQPGSLPSIVGRVGGGAADR